MEALTQQSKEQARAHFDELFIDKTFADFTFVFPLCEDSYLHVHRSSLAVRSVVFNAFFTSNKERKLANIYGMLMRECAIKN